MLVEVIKSRSVQGLMEQKTQVIMVLGHLVKKSYYHRLIGSTIPELIFSNIV